MNQRANQRAGLDSERERERERIVASLANTTSTRMCAWGVVMGARGQAASKTVPSLAASDRGNRRTRALGLLLRRLPHIVRRTNAPRAPGAHERPQVCPRSDTSCEAGRPGRSRRTENTSETIPLARARGTHCSFPARHGPGDTGRHSHLARSSGGAVGTEPSGPGRQPSARGGRGSCRGLHR